MEQLEQQQIKEVNLSEDQKELARLESQTIAKLREMVRALCPNMKRKTINYMRKTEAVEILMSDETDAVAADVETKIEQRIASGDTSVGVDTQEPIISVDVADDVAEPETSGDESAIGVVSADTASKVTLHQCLQAIRMISEDAAKEIVKLIEDSETQKRTLAEQEAKIKKMAKFSQQISHGVTGGNGEVEIGCTMYKLIKDKPCADTPPASPYSFEMWRSVSGLNPTGDSTLVLDVHDLIPMIEKNFRVFLSGPPSVGKTSVIREYCARVNWPMTRINLRHDMTIYDFVGCHEAVNGQTQWVPGPLQIAMEQGHVLILDEIDHAPAECTSVLHSVLEPGGELVIGMLGGKRVRPHPNFRVVATANTKGHGDSSGMYANAKIQDAALLSRFDCYFDVTWPETDKETAFLVSMYNIPIDVAEKITEFASASREKAEKDDSRPITLRQTMALSKLIANGVAFWPAFSVAILQAASEDDRIELSEAAQRVFGENIQDALNKQEN